MCSHWRNSLGGSQVSLRRRMVEYVDHAETMAVDELTVLQGFLDEIYPKP